MHSNRGMFLEELINNTNRYYEKHKIAQIEKRELPILVTSKQQSKISGILKSKSKVDYFGNWKGRHIEFEAKSTSSETFYIYKISTHQLEHLKACKESNSISFLILYFAKHKRFFLIEDINANLSFKHCIEKEKEIPLRFPGILDYLSLLPK